MGLGKGHCCQDKTAKYTIYISHSPIIIISKKPKGDERPHPKERGRVAPWSSGQWCISDQLEPFYPYMEIHALYMEICIAVRPQTCLVSYSLCESPMMWHLTSYIQSLLCPYMEIPVCRTSHTDMGCLGHIWILFVWYVADVASINGHSNKKSCYIWA